MCGSDSRGLGKALSVLAGIRRIKTGTSALFTHELATVNLLNAPVDFIQRDHATLSHDL